MIRNSRRFAVEAAVGGVLLQPIPILGGIVPVDKGINRRLDVGNLSCLDHVVMLTGRKKLVLPRCLVIQIDLGQ